MLKDQDVMTSMKHAMPQFMFSLSRTWDHHVSLIEVDEFHENRSCWFAGKIAY